MGEARRKIIKQNTAQAKQLQDNSPVLMDFHNIFENNKKEIRLVWFTFFRLVFSVGAVVDFTLRIHHHHDRTEQKKKLKKCTIRTSHRLLLKMLSGNSKKAEKRKLPKSLRRWWFDFFWCVLPLFLQFTVRAIGCIWSPPICVFVGRWMRWGFFRFVHAFAGAIIASIIHNNSTKYFVEPESIAGRGSLNAVNARARVCVCVPLTNNN